MIATAYALAGKPWLEVVGRMGLEQARDNSPSVDGINDPDVICKIAQLSKQNWTGRGSDNSPNTVFQ